MALTISDGLKKQISDFFNSLSDHDREMLEVRTKKWTAQLRAVARRQPTGCSMGRWDDRNGATPNEVESDDANL